MASAVVPVLVFAGLCLGVFLYALRTRWFSRLENGFLATIIFAIAGFAFLGALVSGVWQYQAGKDIIHREIVDALGTTGQIVQANLAEMIGIEIEQQARYSRYLPDKLSPAKHEALAADLRYMDELNDEILQIDVFDGHGMPLSSSNVTTAPEQVDHTAVGLALDGKRYVSDAYRSPASHRYVLVIAVPIRDAHGGTAGALVIRYDLDRELSSLIRSTRFDEDGYAVITDSAGRILAHPDARRVGEDLSSYPAIQEGRQGKKGWVTGRNQEGKQRLFVYQPIRSPATLNPQSWVLMTESDEAKALAPVRALGYQLLIGIALFTLPGLLIARQVASSISRPVQRLVEFVRTVQGGDLSGRVAVEGKDEIGRLGGALNEMVKGLNERDRVKEIFGRYVATQVSDKILKGEVNLGGESRRVTILFSDIRNFTSMAEQMTPTQVVSFLNDYFSEMVEAVFGQGGVLDKFLGDGMMAVFGSMGDMPDHPRRAVLAALRMKAVLGKINGERGVAGKPPIAIGIGIHTDDVIVGNIGTRKRLEYTVVGDGVNTCSRVESLNKELGTTILVTQTTWEELKDEFVGRPMPDQALRGKKKSLALYEVISAKAAA